MSLELVPASEATRKRMRATRRRDTAPELLLRRELHGRGLRYFVDTAVLSGLRRRADIVFPRKRIAVFVDGCFWHGCPEHRTTPKTNTDFWLEKISRNEARDRDTNALLADAGWTVVRVWEHEDVRPAADEIERLARKESDR